MRHERKIAPWRHMDGIQLRGEGLAEPDKAGHVDVGEDHVVAVQTQEHLGSGPADQEVVGVVTGDDRQAGRDARCGQQLFR